jgi:hypothetical protein
MLAFEWTDYMFPQAIGTTEADKRKPRSLNPRRFRKLRSNSKRVSLFSCLPGVNYLQMFRGINAPDYSCFSTVGPVRSSDGGSAEVLVRWGAADASNLASLVIRFSGCVAASDSGATGLLAFVGTGAFGGG